MKPTPELFNVPEREMGPEDTMQTDLIAELSPSAGYENIVTAMDVFSRYVFSYPVSTSTAVNTSKVVIDNMTRHSYLPTLMVTDKGSVFISQVNSRIAAVLGITLKHASTKHAQTIGVLEKNMTQLKPH